MKNFYYLLAFLMISLITSCSDNSVNTSAPEPIPMPKNFYRLDTKTPFDDKYDLQGLKAGLNTYVDKYGGWCRKEEFGEDFSIWIEDLSRVMKTETEWEVSFKLTVAQPSATTKKEYLKKKGYA